MNPDKVFMRQAMKLAKKGMGWTNPNPMVGAVIVKNGKIIGKGYHKKSGFVHAEVEALKNCKKDPAGATLYVNLEPCNHFGKTPPCAEAIISAGIKKVVCSSLDPNPKTHGLSVEKLKKSGLEVVVGLLENETKVLNEAFFTFHEKKRPFVAIKFASSLDGKIATYTGDSKWITNEKAREYGRRLRGQYQSVLVGINTVLKDNPHLGVRIKGYKDPVRIIIDPHYKMPEDAKVLRDSNVLVFNEQITIPKLLENLKEKGIISCLVEGGGDTLGRFVDSGLIDKVYVFHAPVLIGGERAISAIGGQGAENVAKALHLKKVSFRKFDDNMLTIGYLI